MTQKALRVSPTSASHKYSFESILPQRSKKRYTKELSFSAFESFQNFIEDKFTNGSAVDGELVKANVEFTSDQIYDYGGEIYTPIDDALNRKTSRFGHSARDNYYGAIIRNEDGSVWQVILSLPNGDKPYRRSAPTGNGDRAFLPAIPPNIRNKIAKRYGVEVPLTGSFWEWFAGTNLPGIITEGAEKALSLLSEGYIALSLYGCTCGRNNPDLLRFTNNPRTWLIGFDSDTKKTARIAVAAGVKRLRNKLNPFGRVGVLRWSSADGKGVDDFIANKGIEPFNAVYQLGIIDAQNYDPIISRSQWEINRLVARCSKQFEKIGQIFKRESPKHILQTAPKPEKQPDITYYKPGDDVKVYFILADQGYKYILNASATGAGKSTNVGKAVPNDLGVNQLFYAADDHRNPSTAEVELWKDLPARNDGMVRDDSQLTPLGNPYVRWRKPDERNNLPGNCYHTPLFRALANKGWLEASQEASSNPICKACRFRSNCSGTDKYGNVTQQIEGYTFRRDREEALLSPQVRGHISTIPKNDSKPDDDGNEYKTALVIEEFSKSFKPVIHTEVSLSDLDTALIDVDQKLPELGEELEFLLPLRELLSKGCKENYGLNYKQILEIIGTLPINLNSTIELLELNQPDLQDLIQDADSVSKQGLSKSDRNSVSKKTLAYIRSKFRKQATQETLDNINNLPSNSLLPLLKVLAGHCAGSIRFSKSSGYKLVITLHNEELVERTKSHNLVIALDATATKDSFAAKLDIDPSKVAVVSMEPPTYENLTITAVTGLGYLGERSEDKKARVAALRNHYTEQYGAGVGFIDFKKYKQDGDGHWFVDNRGSNKYRAKKALVSFGIPYENIGALQCEFTTLTGSIDYEGAEFQNFIKQRWQSEIIQNVGRLRSHLRPDEKLEVVLVNDEDLSFLPAQFPGAAARVIDAFDLTPQAGTKNQRNFYAVKQACQQLKELGQKVTQRAIAKIAKISQPTVSRVLNAVGGFKGIEKLFTSLLTNYREMNQNSDVPLEMIEAIADLDPSKLLNELALVSQSIGISELARYLTCCSSKARVRYFLALAAILPISAQEILLAKMQKKLIDIQYQLI